MEEKGKIKTDQDYPAHIGEIIKTMHKEHFGNEIKKALAEIIIKYYPNAPVKNFLKEDKREGHPTRDWG